MKIATADLPWDRSPLLARAVELVNAAALGEDACVEWPGGRNDRGYGRLSIRLQGGRVVSMFAHRIMYERANGPIPDGLTLDHLCRNRACVNPAHLEPVTQGENNLRGLRDRLGYDAHAMCINGHPRTDENTYRYSYGRWCRPCALDRMAGRPRSRVHVATA